MVSLAELSQELAAAVAQAGQTVVAVNGRRRMTSSGVLWRPGLVVTAEHSLKRDDEITVTLADDRTVTATLVGRDASTDLAVLRLGEENLPVAEQADPTALHIGHLVLAIARDDESGVNASLGILSAISGPWRSWQGGQIDQLIRPDLTLYPGFSGGALINIQAQVIGINTAGPRHMALTIPAATVDRVVDQLLQRGHMTRGYLGVGLQPVQLPDSLKTSLNLSQTEAVIVVSLDPDSPADRAGVLIGDVLIALGDHSTEDVRDVHAALDPNRVGQPLTAQLIRAGAIVELTIDIGERPVSSERPHREERRRCR